MDGDLRLLLIIVMHTRILPHRTTTTYTIITTTIITRPDPGLQQLQSATEIGTGNASAILITPF